MIYAKRVKSPLKGGVDVELGPKTCLVGVNGAGKTAVLQALKLGTRGFVDDQEGKDGVAVTAALARLFPEGAELKSEVEMSDGTAFSWASKPRGGGFTKPKSTGKERPYRIHFPFQDIKALLSGDDKKIRSWLEHRVGSDLSGADLLEMLPPTQHGEAKKALSYFTPRSPVELSVKLKAEARTLRASSTRKEKTIDSLVEGIPLPLSDSDVAALTERAAELWTQATLPGLMNPDQHERLRASIVDLVEALAQIEESIDTLPESQEGEEETHRIAAKGHALTTEHLTHLGHEVCYVCLRKDADIEGAYSRWSGILGGLQAAASRQRLQAQYEEGHTQAEKLAEQYKSAVVVDTTPVLEEHTGITAQLATHQANKRVWGQAEGLRKEVASDRSVADTYTALARTWEKEGQTLLLQRKTSYEKQVSAWLPSGESFAVDLRAGRVGLVVNGAVHTSLSGAEMSRVLLAILSSEGSEGSDSTPSILEPEDRGWDPDTLADVMTALTDSPDQVILMSTVLPARSPEGWSIIQV